MENKSLLFIFNFYVKFIYLFKLNQDNNNINNNNTNAPKGIGRKKGGRGQNISNISNHNKNNC